MKTIVAQPFPAFAPSESRFRFPVIAGMVVFLIILFFKPFDFSKDSSPYFPVHALLFGLGTVGTALLNSWLIPKLLPAWFEERHWTVGKELLMMLWQVISISFTNMALTRLLYGGSFSFLSVIDFLGYTSAIGIFPVTILVLIKYVIFLKKNQTAATNIEQEINEKQENMGPGSQVVKLKGDYQNEELEVHVDNIHFMLSADNYIKVYYIENNRLVSKLLRSTLKKTEQILSDYPQFFRCHRTYLVNLKRVQHVSGNAQGLKLHLQNTEELIPVSRSLNQQLKFHLQQQKRL